MKRYIITEEQLRKIILLEQTINDIKTIELNISNKVKRKFEIKVTKRDKEKKPKETELSIENKDKKMVKVNLTSLLLRANLISAKYVNGVLNLESVSGNKGTISKEDINRIIQFIDNPEEEEITVQLKGETGRSINLTMEKE